MEQHFIEKRYHLLTDTEDLIVISTPERKRKYVNKAYCKFFERNESDLLGTCFEDEFSTEKKEMYARIIKEISPANPSISSIQKSGNPGNQKWIHWKETGIYDDKDRLVEIVSVGRDIDDVINAKMQRDEVSNLLNAYRDAIDSNILCSITDKYGNITFANRQFCLVSQYRSSELLGKCHSIVNSGYHSHGFFANMWETIVSGKMWDGDIRNRARDGSIYWVNSVIIPVRGADNKISSYLSLGNLITEKKQYEEERANYMRSLEEMIFMVSHELRKPISTILGVLDVMQHSPGEPDNATYIKYMTDSTNLLDSYVRKMNDYLQINRENANWVRYPARKELKEN